MAKKLQIIGEVCFLSLFCISYAQKHVSQTNTEKVDPGCTVSYPFRCDDGTSNCYRLEDICNGWRECSNRADEQNCARINPQYNEDMTPEEAWKRRSNRRKNHHDESHDFVWLGWLIAPIAFFTICVGYIKYKQVKSRKVEARRAQEANQAPVITGPQEPVLHPVYYPYPTPTRITMTPPPYTPTDISSGDTNPPSYEYPQAPYSSTQPTFDVRTTVTSDAVVTSQPFYNEPPPVYQETAPKYEEWPEAYTQLDPELTSTLPTYESLTKEPEPPTEPDQLQDSTNLLELETCDISNVSEQDSGRQS